MTTQTFKPGELVNVQLRGVRYVGSSGTVITIQTADPNECYWDIPPQAAVERVAPKEWPPQPGDVWEDRDGDEWVARSSSDGQVDLGPVIAVPNKLYDDPDNAAAHHGPMRLVRRRGWTVDQPGAEPTPEQVDLRAARIAGVRAFAELIETRPDVPTPHGIHGQVSLAGEEGLAAAKRLAATLGVEFGRIYDTGDQVQRYACAARLDFGGDVTLSLYVHGLDAPEPAEPVDCCPDAADEPAGPVPLVDAEPAEAAGETVEDAEVTL